MPKNDLDDPFNPVGSMKRLIQKQEEILQEQREILGASKCVLLEVKVLRDEILHIRDSIRKTPCEDKSPPAVPPNTVGPKSVRRVPPKVPHTDDGDFFKNLEPHWDIDEECL